MRSLLGASLALVLPLTASAEARRVDLALVNGKIVTVDPARPAARAIAVSGDRIEAVGGDAEIRRLAGPGARVIDLHGATVIPGLIDSHMHAVRAALSFATEVNWIGARSIPEAMARISDKARQAGPGRWIIVAGGWIPDQFAEKRMPTQAELLAAAPNNPAYVQLTYERALLTPRAFETLGLKSDADLPAGGRIERDGEGRPTGWIVGGVIGLFARLPLPTYAEQLEGGRRFYRELNRLGMTGVVDPGGFGMVPASYSSTFQLWREGRLTIRIAYSLFGMEAGKELEEYETSTRMAPAQFGDEMLHMNGIGERVTLAMYNNDNPSEAQQKEFYAVIRWAAQNGQTFTIHWQQDRSVHILLDLLERLNAEVPLAPLHWTIAHLNDASPASLARMKRLGLGWTLQDERYFARDAGPGPEADTPRVVTAIKLGLPIGAGTDAHRVMSYNPFVALQWLLDGKTAGGASTRGAAEIPTRAEALRLYTLGSAWVSRDETRRGSLTPGKLADFAVLTEDYMTIPLDRISRLESVLTVVGGKVVYAAGPYAGLERSGPSEKAKAN